MGSHARRMQAMVRRILAEHPPVPAPTLEQVDRAADRDAPNHEVNVHKTYTAPTDEGRGCVRE